MERFTVYHLMPEFSRDSHFKLFPWTCYTLIATVEAEALGQTFELTNHIESNWTDNPTTLELFVSKDRVRSTSVGDVVSDEMGDFYRCDMCGWNKLDAAWFTDRQSTPKDIEIPGYVAS